jgi:SPP1 gp7 family putative phage head morphogenesis protein
MGDGMVTLALAGPLPEGLRQAAVSAGLANPVPAPAAATPAATWAGWERDQDIAGIYAPKVSNAFAAGMAAAEVFLEQLMSGQVRVTPTYAAQEVSRRLATALQTALAPLWTEAYALGVISASYAVATLADAPASATSAATAITKLSGDPYPLPVSTPDWGGWQPGDLDAAAKVATSARLTELLHQWGINVIQSISQTRLGDLAQVIASALADGKSSGQLATEISGMLNVPSRANMIAQTEVSRASSAATLDTYVQQGVSTKEWLVAPDERVCPVCRAAEAEGPIPLTQAFDNGVDAPPGHPRCRCSIIPSSIGDFDLSDMTVEPLPGFNVVPFGGRQLVSKVGPEGYVHGWIYEGGGHPRQTTSHGYLQPEVNGGRLKSLTSQARAMGRQLSPAQQKAVTQWTSGKGMVRRIQSGGASAATLDSFDQAMKQLPKVDGLVYRGVKPDTLGARQAEALKPGDTVHLHHPVSTSVDPRQSAGFGTYIYEVHAPGAAAYTAPLSKFAYEKEAVLAPGQYAVTSVEDGKIGLGSVTSPIRVIHLEGTEPPDGWSWMPVEGS